MSYNVKSRRSTRHNLATPPPGATAMLLALAGMLGMLQQTSAADGEFVNLSTRGWVGTGNDVGIVGFIIEDGSRQVLIQALGPELVNRGISNALADPVLTVSQTSEGEPPRAMLDPPVQIMVNDNWEDSQGQLVSDLWEGSPPLSAGSLSAAVVLTLEPGEYTAKVQGKNETVGVASVEVYRIASKGESKETTHVVGATLSDLPTGSWSPDLSAGGVSFSSSGGNVTLRFNDGGYIEEGNYRYTCQGSGGCAIENRGVTSGTIVQTAKGTAPGGGSGTDSKPSFASGSGPGNQSYTVGAAISALTLPEANGGDGPLTYTLSPTVPGLSFNPATRLLTGTPTSAGTHSMTYTVTDTDGDTDSLSFTITVAEPPPEDNYTPLEGLRVTAGRVQYSFFSAGGCIRLNNSTINGVTYNTHSSKWQRRADADSPWQDVPGTEEQGGFCAYNPTSPGEYRLVGELSINGRRGSYSSENTIIVN